MKNKSLNFRPLLSICLILGLLLATSNAAAQECHTEVEAPESKAEDPGDPIGADCDFMRYLPEPSDPETVIRVRFHIIQDDDGSDNFQPGDVNLLAIEAYLENHAFITVPPPVWPVLPPSQELSSSKIRFSIDDNYVYHQSSQHNILDDIQNFAGTLNLSPNYIHVFLTEGPGNADIGAFSGGRVIGQYGTWSTVTMNSASVYFAGISLAHELGHSLGLYHTHGLAGPMDTFVDTPEDLGRGAPFYDSQDPNNVLGLNRSNNVMSYNWAGAATTWMSTGRYLSPSQIATMHHKINTSSWLWQVVKPPADHCQQGPETVIDEDTVWSKSRFLPGDLVVEPGVSLTVTCRSQIGLPDEAKIMVRNAGTLIVEKNSIMGPSCDGMWQGVELWGDPTAPQVYNKGKLVLRSGGGLEHARTAVSTLRRTDNGQVVWQSSGGGIIECDGGRFYNNARAVLMTPYTNTTFGGLALPDESYFKGCSFINSEPLRDTSYAVSGYSVPVLSYVALWGVSGISFNNATFYNSHADQYLKPSPLFPEVRGVGIISLNASYTLDHAQFNYVSRGVEFYSQPLASQLTGKRNTFRGTEHGFVVEGGGPHLLGWNNFYDQAGALDPNVLIYSSEILRGTNGFEVFQNNHMRDTQLTQPLLSAGTVVEDSGIWGGSLYRNYYSEPMLGVALVGDNWQASAECNRFANNSVGLWIDGSNPSGLPSTWGCAGSPTEDLGNSFLTSCNNLPQNGQHIAVGGNTTLDYRLASGAATAADGSCSSNVNLNACGGGLQPNACPLILPFLVASPRPTSPDSKLADWQEILPPHADDESVRRALASLARKAEDSGAKDSGAKDSGEGGAPEPNYLELSDDEVDQLRAQALAGDHFALGVLRFIGKADEELLMLPVIPIDWSSEGKSKSCCLWQI